MEVVYIILGLSWVMSLIFVYMVGMSAGQMTVVRQFAGTVEKVTNGIAVLIKKIEKGQK